VGPENLPVRGLHRYIGYLEANALDASRYQLAFWHKLFQPLAIAVMMLLALPFVLGPLRTSSGGARLVAGAVVGFGFYLFDLVAGQLSLVYGLPPLFGAALPTLVFFGGAWVLLRRIA
jgi:lipopolysaccharide export system permease protein